MADASTAQLQVWIDRMQAGDEAARRELVGHAYERLRCLARVILHQDFPRLENLHGTGSVLHEAAIKLLEALRTARPPTVRDFLRLAAALIRRTLLDLARHADRHRHELLAANGLRGDSCLTPLQAAADSTQDPVGQAIWTEFHDKVEELPEQERDVVDLHWYQGLTFGEAARLLNVSEPTVKRRWLAARRRLYRALKGGLPGP